MDQPSSVSIAAQALPASSSSPNVAPARSSSTDQILFTPPEYPSSIASLCYEKILACIPWPGAGPTRTHLASVPRASQVAVLLEQSESADTLNGKAGASGAEKDAKNAENGGKDAEEKGDEKQGDKKEEGQPAELEEEADDVAGESEEADECEVPLTRVQTWMLAARAFIPVVLAELTIVCGLLLEGYVNVREKRSGIQQRIEWVSANLSALPDGAALLSRLQAELGALGVSLSSMLQNGDSFDSLVWGATG